MMHINLIDTAQEIINTPNIYDLKEIIDDLLKQIKIDYFSYYTQDTSGSKLIANYPAEWIEEYNKHHYGKIDPVVNLSSCLFTPKTWKEYIDYSNLTDSEYNFMQKAKHYRIDVGVSVVVKGAEYAPSVFSLVTSEEKVLESGANLKCIVGLLAGIIDGKIRSFLAKERPKLLLTARESEILLWTSRGKTSWEISKILAISKNTVQVHIKSFIRKLNVVSKTQAVTIALLTGNLKLDEVYSKGE